MVFPTKKKKKKLPKIVRRGRETGVEKTGRGAKTLPLTAQRRRNSL